MLRRNRTVAGVCIAVVVLAAFLPGLGALGCALFEPQWVLLPDEVIVAIDLAVTPCHEHPSSLLSLLSSRGPPARPLA